MSEISKQALLVDNSQSFPNNNAGAITPANLRAFNVNMIDSLVDEIGYNVDSASWNQQITALEVFTSSQQPSFTALNSFTASQIVTNTNLNQFTQSANQELDSLSAWTGSWEAWTSSINEIRDDGVLQGYSTRFYFNGLVSASIVQNVNGPIANVTIQQDGTKLNTSSFNDYTASTAATQSVFSASVATSISASSNAFNQFSASQNSFNLSATASIVELLNLSSSLSGGYATQGELDQSSSVLQANIDTKLNTSSFNQYTQSQNSLNVTFATTGSNTFVGNQTISASLFVSGNINMVNGTDIVTHHVKAPGVNGVEIQTNTGGVVALFGAGGSLGTTFYGQINATSISASTINGLGNPLAFSQSVDERLDITATTGSNVFIGNQTFTGSVFQNVSASSITSQTASIDLSVANYFTLTLSGSTNINITNPRPGVTATLVINTDTGASASFSSNVKQPSGSFYAASPSGNIDIISFTAVNNTTVYAFPAQSFV